MRASHPGRLRSAREDASVGAVVRRGFRVRFPLRPGASASRPARAGSLRRRQCAFACIAVRHRLRATPSGRAHRHRLRARLFDGLECRLAPFGPASWPRRSGGSASRWVAVGTVRFGAPSRPRPCRTAAPLRRQCGAAPAPGAQPTPVYRLRRPGRLRPASAVAKALPSPGRKDQRRGAPRRRCRRRPMPQGGGLRTQPRPCPTPRGRGRGPARRDAGSDPLPAGPPSPSSDGFGSSWRRFVRLP